MDEFKEELKNTIVKIDKQLKAKVDTSNFENYGKQIDNKILNEFSKKIEKNDLRKNNVIITKKVKINYISLIINKKASFNLFDIKNLF
jgi:hypothetical protein